MLVKLMGSFKLRPKLYSSPPSFHTPLYSKIAHLSHPNHEETVPFQKLAIKFKNANHTESLPPGPVLTQTQAA